MEDLPDIVLRFIRTHDLLRPGERVIVALSGGPDSVALALTLLSLDRGGALPLDISLAHLNHCARGKESDREEAFCRAFADRQGLKLEVERTDVREHARRRGQSFEAAGRAVRYAFLDRLAREKGADAVATGHHADDVAETVLLRLIRGAGLTALGGLAPSRPFCSAVPGVRLVRPLLDVRRSEILAYLAREGEPFCTDASNRDTAFTRNRVRHVLIPLLEREFPSFSVRSLCTLNASALELAALIESLLEDLWPRLCKSAGPDAVTLDEEAFAGAPVPLRKAAVARAFGILCGLARPPALGAEHFERTARLSEQPVGSSVALPRGILARHEHGLIRFAQPTEALGLPWRALNAPGRVDLPEIGVRIEARAAPCSAVGPPEAAASASDSEVFLDLGAAGPALAVRSRRPGDRFHPLGAPGVTRLKKFLIDRKVPQSERDRIPLVIAQGDRIAWVVGHQIGDPFKLRSYGSAVLHLRAVRMDEGGA